MFKNLKLSCDQATAICDKSQYGEASIKELIILKIHFVRCKICVIYSKQNTILSAFYGAYSKGCKDLNHCLSSEEKEELKGLLAQKNKL
jgi:hypothetical protein